MTGFVVKTILKVGSGLKKVVTKLFRKEETEDVTEEKEIEPLDLSLLLDAFNNFLQRKEDEKPLNTKITNKEYSVDVRSHEIFSLLKEKKRMNFYDLFNNSSRDYIVVTFLSILDLAKKQKIKLIQDNNFNNIVLSIKEDE